MGKQDVQHHNGPQWPKHQKKMTHSVGHTARQCHLSQSHGQHANNTHTYMLSSLLCRSRAALSSARIVCANVQHVSRFTNIATNIKTNANTNTNTNTFTLSSHLQNHSDLRTHLRKSELNTVKSTQCLWFSSSTNTNNNTTNTSFRPLTALTDDEKMLQETVYKFANEKIKPFVSEMDEKSEMHPSILPALFSAGLMGVEIDPSFGGTGMTFFDSVIVIEELARIDPAVSVMVDIQNTLVNKIISSHGTDAQRKKYLPRLATDTLSSFCLSESSSGSDAFALKTRAELKGDRWVLNGNKLWISNSKEAGIFVVFANADPSKGYKGITCFVVEKGTPGLTVGKKENKLGIRASSTCEVVFEDCSIPKENVIGEVGKGYQIAIGTLNEGRIGIGAQMVGLAQGAFDATMPYINTRKQFGQVISSFQGMQFLYAQARTDIEAARLMVYNAARLRDAGMSCVQEAAMAKLFSSQVADRVASVCVEMMGGVGFTKDFPQEKFYRDAKVGAIYEGTSNLQLQTIAKMIQKQYPV